MKSSYLLKSFLVFAFAVNFIISQSCKNKMEDINAIATSDTFPISTGINVEIIYSDSALIQAVIKAPVYKRYAGEDPYVEMPQGITAIFYDSVMQVKTKLTSKYAISYDRKNLMEAKNDVVVVNAKGEKLNTEELYWDEKKKRIYTDVFVKITTTDKIFYGDGMDADESFVKWTIRKPRGTFYISDEELNTN